MKRFTKWAEREFGIMERVSATLAAGFLFVVLMPLFIIKMSEFLDIRYGISRFEFCLPNFLLGSVLILLGMFLALWSVIVQIVHAKGTPLPMLPTQTLLTSPPFSYCRNPMTFGTIMLYSGLGVWIGSVSGLGVVLLFAFSLIIYLKRVEEVELEGRFGEEYLKYKERTPFMLPRFRPGD